MKRSGIQRKTPMKRGRKQMRRSRSTGKPTVTQVARWDLIRTLPCICCSFAGSPYMRVPGQPIEIHHLLSGARRRGHDFTIGICSWHHRAVPPIQSGSMETMTAMYGPSLANGSKPLHAVYGSDDELLALQNQRLVTLQAAA